MTRRLVRADAHGTLAAVPSMTCPRCRLSIRPRAAYLVVDHCPRCIARDSVAIAMTREPAAGDIAARLHGLNWRTPDERSGPPPGS